MGVAMGGMGTAFGTTLVGLTIALILTIFNLAYQTYWSRYEHHLTETFFLRLYPAFVPPSQESMVHILLDAIEQLVKAVKVIKIGNQKLGRALENLSETMEDYNKNIQRLVERISKAVNEFVKSQKGNQEMFVSIKKLPNKPPLVLKEFNAYWTNRSQTARHFWLICKVVAMKSVKLANFNTRLMKKPIAIFC